MTDSDRSDTAPVALELERLRGTLEAGFARADGALALHVQRSDQTDKQLADHEARLDALERARWPLAGIAATTASAGLLLAVWELAGRWLRVPTERRRAVTPYETR